jgi:cytoskeletal protein CcmA (bactofilin family)
MLTRSPSADPKAANAANGTQRRSGPESAEKSVIGNDLKIIGQGLKIIGRGVLQVDGEIEGDVQAAEVIVGEKGQVTGMVAGRQVVVRGKVSGVICGRTIALQASSNVDGDLHHMSLLIEQGAMFDGRSRRAVSEADLNAIVEGKGGPQKIV